MSRVRYSTNWMGVANLEWYRDRGLLKKRTITFEEDSLLVRGGKYKPGDALEIEEPQQSYSCGRIDVRGGDIGPYGDEIGVPPMKEDSWGRFGKWLGTFETDDVWTLGQLIWMYERNNPKIEWYEPPEWYPYNPV